jgi:hypothetical protein
MNAEKKDQTRSEKTNPLKFDLGFSVLSAFICVLLLVCGFVANLPAAAPAKTRITDTLYEADGTLATCTLEISWARFTAGDGTTVDGGKLSAETVKGLVDIYLIPQTATYTVRYACARTVSGLARQTTYTEYWIVPVSVTAVTISTVRTSYGTAPSAVIAESQVTNLLSDLAGKPPNARTISAGSGLSGGGDLSADRTLTCLTASASLFGCLTAADWSTFNSKQPAGSYALTTTPSTAGTGPNWVAAVLNIPDAGTASVTAGTVSKTKYDAWDAKQAALGYTPENVANKAAASGYASLDGSSLVVQNPANATATPTASKIPMTEAGGPTLDDGWIPAALAHTTSVNGSTVPASDTLVGRATTDTLSNKILIVTTARTVATGDITLTSASASYQFIDPNGANRNCTLPGTPATGLAYTVKHFGTANTVVVKDAAAATLVTLTAGDTATVIYDGTAWQVI